MSRPCNSLANHLCALLPAIGLVAPEQPGLSQSAGPFPAYITN